MLLHILPDRGVRKPPVAGVDEKEVTAHLPQLVAVDEIKLRFAGGVRRGVGIISRIDADCPRRLIPGQGLDKTHHPLEGSFNLSFLVNSAVWEHFGENGVVNFR